MTLQFSENPDYIIEHPVETWNRCGFSFGSSWKRSVWRRSEISGHNDDELSVYSICPFVGVFWQYFWTECESRHIFRHSGAVLQKPRRLRNRCKIRVAEGGCCRVRRNRSQGRGQKPSPPLIMLFSPYLLPKYCYNLS